MFTDPSQEFTYVRSYSRWLEGSQRRETWEETVERYVDFIVTRRKEGIPQRTIRKIKERILNLDVMPSMRAAWSAGPAADRDNTCMFNCAFQAIDSIESFAECLFILMCGTGYGFSVERKYVDRLPIVPPFTGKGAGEHIVADSKEGWADSLKVLLTALYSGQDVTMNYTEVRQQGARLVTMGGRSSGPAPLLTLHNFVRETFAAAQGRKLTSLECHDILNQIAEIVVVGGVRRSSQISLSDLDDVDMAQAKAWPFPPRRSMANNSAVYIDKPPASRFLVEWGNLANSGTGERGIFNLYAARNTAPSRRKGHLIAGTNPCAEISLRPRQFCNLSEVVVRVDDDLDDLLDKVETAVWLGAIQSTFTHFPYLSRQWARNCNEERLLGVSLTGQFDNLRLLDDPTVLISLNVKALKVAKHASVKLGVPMSAAVTCGKPSGTVSQLVNCASGCHARYSDYYLRRYRISSTDPLFRMLRDQGLEFVPEIGQRHSDWESAKTTGDFSKCSVFEQGKKWSSDKVRTWVCSFPVKSPSGSVTRSQVSAVEQLEHYVKIQGNWCEHNQSCTVYVKPDEWFSVGDFVYKNWDIMNGVSFLPYDGGHYDLAPYEEITEERFKKEKGAFPVLDYSKLPIYETDDQSSGSKSWACVGDVCEL